MDVAHAPFRAPALLLAVCALAGCASAPRPTPVLPAPPHRPAPLAPTPRFGDRVDAERARLGADRIAEHVSLGGTEEPLHLVLEAGACYRFVALVDEGSIDVLLEDEHGLAVGRASGSSEARLGGEEGLCPRWTGSFALSVSVPETWRRHAVFVERAGGAAQTGAPETGAPETGAE